jgi:elongation factor 1 alpha-like protein
VTKPLLSSVSDQLSLLIPITHHQIAIEIDGESLLWAAAGHNVNLYLSGIDPIHLGYFFLQVFSALRLSIYSIGSVLCPLTSPVPLVSSFVAQVMIFDIQIPIIIGASVSLNYMPSCAK